MVDRKRIFSGLVLGVFLAATAVPSLAGGYMHKSRGHEKAVGQEKSMRHQTETPYSEIETKGRFWSQSEAGVSAEFWGPVEVGTLPGAERGSRLVDTGVDPSRWAAPIAE